MKTLSAPAYHASVYMAGDIDQAKRSCAEYCLNTGLCVTVTPTEFIYTGGRELGFVVELVNYPRFPATPHDIGEKAKNLALMLILEIHQHTALVTTPDESMWFTRRPEHLNDETLG